MTNREAMWNAADVKYQAGAFGQIGDLETLVLYWKFMEKANYPSAGEILANLQERLQRQQKQAQQMQQLQLAQGGGTDEMSVM